MQSLDDARINQNTVMLNEIHEYCAGLSTVCLRDSDAVKRLEPRVLALLFWRTTCVMLISDSVVTRDLRFREAVLSVSCSRQRVEAACLRTEYVKVQKCKLCWCTLFTITSIVRIQLSVVVKRGLLWTLGVLFPAEWQHVSRRCCDCSYSFVIYAIQHKLCIC